MLTVKCDVLIVGGGLEGSLLARSLHRSGQKVVLLERGRPRDGDAPYDQWVCTPFLYSPQAWSWIDSSQDCWQQLSALGSHAGAALARRESPSWNRLKECQESHWIACPPLQPDQFPELKMESDLGSFFMEKLPCLQHQGVVGRLWQELQREGADPYADTNVTQIDWEHEWPTAVTRDTIFRGRRLFLMAGKETAKLLQQPVPAIQQRHLWLEGSPLLEDRRPVQRPAIWIHYAKAPLYLLPGPERWGMTRLWEPVDEADERIFLKQTQDLWLSCPMQEPALYDLHIDGLADGQPALDYHPWRRDCVWLAGLGQQHWPWLPELVRLLTDPQLPLPDELSVRRLLGGPVATHANH